MISLYVKSGEDINLKWTDLDEINETPTLASPVFLTSSK